MRPALQQAQDQSQDAVSGSSFDQSHELPTTKVLSFAPAAPGSASAANSSLASQPKIPTAALRAHRVISSRPEKVLDAADISDDFYHHLLDWSVSNQVAIVLRSAVYVWNCEVATVELLVDLADQPEKLGGGPDAIVTAVRWHPAGEYLVVGTDSGSTQVWDVPAKKRLRTLKVPPAVYDPALVTEENLNLNPQVGAMDWADESTVTIGYGTGWIVDHDITLATSPVRLLRAHAGLVCGLVYRADGSVFASGGNDNLMCVWGRTHDGPIMSRSEHKAAVKVMFTLFPLPSTHPFLLSFGTVLTSSDVV